MSWLLIGTIAGTLIAQPFADREACEGRAVVLREAKVMVKCVEMPSSSSGLTIWNGNSCMTFEGRQCR